MKLLVVLRSGCSAVMFLLAVLFAQFVHSAPVDVNRFNNLTAVPIFRRTATSANITSNHNRSLLSGRIIGGVPAKSGEFPSFVWAASQGCGGTLIHPDMVLTIASCSAIDNYGYSYFADGVWIGGIRYDGTGTDSEFVAADAEIVHPAYNGTGFQNSIMLVRLAKRSTKPIQKLNFDGKIPATNAAVIAVGLGYTTESGKYPTTLQKVRINVNSDSYCASKSTYYSSTQICTSVPAGGKGPCYSDGGQPLYTSDGKIQIGMFAYLFPGCVLQGYPSYYTRVSKYKEFIISAIKQFSRVPLSPVMAPVSKPLPTPIAAPLPVSPCAVCEGIVWYPRDISPRFCSASRIDYGKIKSYRYSYSAKCQQGCCSSTSSIEDNCCLPPTCRRCPRKIWNINQIRAIGCDPDTSKFKLHHEAKDPTRCTNSCCAHEPKNCCMK